MSKNNKGKSTIEKEEFMDSTLSIWNIPPARAKKIGHPAPYPTELVERFIKLYTYENELILDPFIGSGTTALGALNLKRNYIGYEINKDYIELANKENGVYWYYKNLDKTIELAMDYKKQMDDKIKKLKYTQKKLKDIVIDAYTDTDELPKYDDFNPLKILNSASVEIIDELVIPMEYFIKVETLKLDKKKILKDLKEGIKIPGCELKRKPYIRGLK